jgi:hypothetical protein
MRHPNFDFVQDLLEPILIKDRFAGWQFGGLKFDHFTGSYQLYLTRDDVTKQIKVPGEWIDEIAANDDTFKRRRIKSMLKDELGEEG